jgi:hypothetical protein
MKMKTYSDRPHLDGQECSVHISVLEFLTLRVGCCDKCNNWWFSNTKRTGIKKTRNGRM